MMVFSTLGEQITGVERAGKRHCQVFRLGSSSLFSAFEVMLVSGESDLSHVGQFKCMILHDLTMHF
jgi:hypothetical protein